MNWLLKTEPTEYSFSRLTADKRTVWTGIRNAQARNHLGHMRSGERALIFHTGRERAVVGLAKVVGAARPDPTQAPGESWLAVELAAERALSRPIALREIKETPALRRMAMLRQGRLSVSPVTDEELTLILELGEPRSRK